MQTRAPLDLTPAGTQDWLYKVNDDLKAQVNDLPIEEAMPGGAFIGDGLGRITMNLGATLSDEDPVWEADGATGGIRLKLA